MEERKTSKKQITRSTHIPAPGISGSHITCTSLPITKDSSMHSKPTCQDQDQPYCTNEGGIQSSTAFIVKGTKMPSEDSTSELRKSNSDDKYILNKKDSDLDSDLNSGRSRNAPISQTTTGINGIFQSRVDSFGSSFGSSMGIQVPLRLIDRIPDDQWQPDDSWSANFTAPTQSNNSRRDSVSTPACNSFRSEGTTIPFLPELVPGSSQRSLYPKPRLTYRSCMICPHNTEAINVSTLMPPDTKDDDLSDLEKNAFSVGQSGIFQGDDVNSMLNKASQCELEGDYKTALDYYEECLEFHSQRLTESENSISKQFLNTGALHRSIGVVHWKTGAYSESLNALNKAHAYFQEALASSEKEDVVEITECLCDVLCDIGRVFSSKGDFDEALWRHSESLSMLKSLFVDVKDDCSGHCIDHNVVVARRHECILDKTNGLDENTEVSHPGIARALICMGAVNLNRGKLPVAMELFKGGLDIQRKIVGSKHVDVASTLNYIGTAYEKSGRHDKAMQCYKKARQIYVKVLGNNHIDTAITLSNMGQIYHHIGKHQKAMDSYRSALRVMKEVLGKSHRNYAATLYNLGLVHVQNCDYETAMKVFKEALILQSEALGGEHIDIALTLESIGSIYERKLRIDKALDLYYKALNIRQRAMGDSVFVAVTMDRIGKCQLNLNGDIKEAVLCFDEALRLYRENGITENNPIVWEAKKNAVTAANLFRQKKKDDNDPLIGLEITISTGIE